MRPDGCESAPGLGDYAPFELRYGEAALFWGHRCRHYILPNGSDTSRVSFDCRIVPSELFVDAGAAGSEYVRINQVWARHDPAASAVAAGGDGELTRLSPAEEALRDALQRHFLALRND